MYDFVIYILIKIFSKSRCIVDHVYVYIVSVRVKYVSQDNLYINTSMHGSMERNKTLQNQIILTHYMHPALLQHTSPDDIISQQSHWTTKPFAR